MQIAMIGLGRMGSNMVRRLLKAGHECVVYDTNPETVRQLVQEGARGVDSLDALAAALQPPRHVWMMVPAAIVDRVSGEMAKHLEHGDCLIDGGNSYYHDDLERAQALAEDGIHYLDVGVSGGVRGLERGYCLMIGGPKVAVEQLHAVFTALAPGLQAAPRTPARQGPHAPEERGYLHCGPSGAGHFVKMVHNGIEYGLMAAYAEGFNILRNANAGNQNRDTDAETTPLRDPEHFRYDLDLAAVAEVWRRGSVIASWLLDLTADALHDDPELADYTGRVSDSGEGRWTIKAAIDEGVPAPVLSTALYERFGSRHHDAFADQLLSAMRREFGGHHEKSD
ncbi:MAG: decarboxylating 6-phosphogluconate dehydrogenase [Gammaproteobacteria bacterium]|jgi:6-phosphogluconate dehydrogenase